jgi:histidine ammonia-lyase
MHEIILDGERLSLKDIEQVVFKNYKVRLGEQTLRKIKKCRIFLENKLKEDKIIYGINTGFGALAGKRIPKDKLEDLQTNLILSHAAGSGELLPHEIVKAIILLRAHTLAQGYSGVRLEVVELLLELLNHDIIPLVPAQGSVGASGDLIPLAHLALALLGEGKVLYQGKLMAAAQALQQAGLRPLKLAAKEGLALINGTQMMSAILSLVVIDSERLLKYADLMAALSFFALQGNPSCLQAELHQARPHPGQIASAENLRQIIGKITWKPKRLQDAYSQRCIPQVHGAAKEAYNFVHKIVSREINSATDNPLIFPEQDLILAGGNFHGAPLALSADILAIALSYLGTISERRIERLLNTDYSGYPPFLSQNSGINSGLMLLQYNAAALVSENKTLAHPASVDSIPTSANQEDHVSMGAWAARKCRIVLQNVLKILAMEYLCAAQALEFLSLPKPPGIEILYQALRQKVKPLKEDRILAGDLDAALNLLQNDKLINKVEKAVGRLKVFSL